MTVILLNDSSYTLYHLTMTWFCTCIGGIGCEGVDRGQSRHCLDAVEIYNADGNYWSDGPPLPCAQLSLRTNGCNAGVVGGKIYVCGYYKGAGEWNETKSISIEMFEIVFGSQCNSPTVSSPPSDRHDDITKEILELDPCGKRWSVVARQVLMHDNYDVCLVAKLNPRGLMSPSADLVKVWHPCHIRSKSVC